MSGNNRGLSRGWDGLHISVMFNAENVRSLVGATTIIIKNV
jgi:hypothetical protein